MSDESPKKNSIRSKFAAKAIDVVKFQEPAPKDKSKRFNLMAQQLAEQENENDEDIISDAPLDGRDIFESPGALRGSSQLVLETRKAQMIFEGRKPNKLKNKSFIIGLNSFASQLRIIYDASGEGDPYADYWLIQVERALEEKLEMFDATIEKYTKILGQYENINHEVAHSIKPITKTLRFSIAYSYQGATMLMKLDQLIRTILTANHVGLVDSHTSSRDIRRAAKNARATFERVVGFRFCDLTRDDVAANNPKAQRAQDLMGGCPSAILEDQIAPKFVSSKAMYLKSKRLRKAVEKLE